MVFGVSWEDQDQTLGSSRILIPKDGGEDFPGAINYPSLGFIPRGWNLFFSGTGTADFHPEVLEKARPISPLAEIRQNNARKNCGKDLNSTPWFASDCTDHMNADRFRV